MKLSWILCVWIDLLCINQHDREPMNLTVVNRLISVIGRTMMITDHTTTEVFKRLWVCYEVTMCSDFGSVM
jgi:hypothetical protein